MRSSRAGLIVAFRLAGLLNLNVKGLPIYRTLFYLPSIASGVSDGRGVVVDFSAKRPV